MSLPPANENGVSDVKLSQRYQSLPQEGPPTHLDNEILRTARDAVRDKPKRIRWILPPMWLTPLATVAMVLVVVGLIRVLPDPSTSVPSPAALEVLRSNNEMTPAETQGEHSRKAPVESVEDLRQAVSAPAQEPKQKIAPESVPVPKPQLEMEESTLLRKESFVQDKAKAAKELSGQSTMPTKPNREQDSANQFRTDEVLSDQVEITAEEAELGDDAKKRELSLVEKRSAEQWVVQINNLIAKQEFEQAKHQLKEFAKAYPNHPQLEALKKVLGSEPNTF